MGHGGHAKQSESEINWRLRDKIARKQNIKMLDRNNDNFSVTSPKSYRKEVYSSSSVKVFSVVRIVNV